MIRRLALPIALLVALVIASRFLVGDESRAELENNVFTSRSDRLRLIVPRNWRATDHPTYPGLLLWIMRSNPSGQIVLTSETFTRDLYCSWPPQCRATGDTPTAKYACALRLKLQALKMRVEGIENGPKENAAVGLASVFFDYDDGKHFLRQAIAVSSDRAISLVLSTSSSDARASLIRSFNDALRSLRPLTAAEANAPTPASAATATVPLDALLPDAPPDAPVVVTDGGPADAAVAVDAAAPVVGAPPAFESAPAPKIDPVGPCPRSP